ncbi:hypothetical protein E2P81_ATG06059 [Venturia nashicola]|nr:hypothetical protein E2P81_ATG06059 [Venturia nashicola]
MAKKRRAIAQPPEVRQQFKALPDPSTGSKTTLLSLPRELRQAIFLLARPHRTTWTEEKEWIQKTAEIWRRAFADPAVNEDIGYVEQKVVERLTKELKDGMGWEWAELQRQEISLDKEAFENCLWGRLVRPTGVEWTIGKPGKTCLVVLKVLGLKM